MPPTNATDPLRTTYHDARAATHRRREPGLLNTLSCCPALSGLCCATPTRRLTMRDQSP